MINATTTEESEWSEDDDPCDSVVKFFTVTLLIFAILGVLLNAFLLYICLEFLFSKKSFKKYDRPWKRGDVPEIEPRPQYALNCFVFNGALAAILASTVQTIRGVGNTFFDGDIILILTSSSGEQNEHFRRLSEILMFMSTLFGPFAVAHFNFLLLLNAEKLFFILKPLHYYRLMNKKGRAAVACLLMWSFSFTWVPMMVACRDNEEQLKMETILVGVLYLFPTLFGLAAATIVAVTVHRINATDRQNLQQMVGGDQEPLSGKFPNRPAVTIWRSFRGIVWATMFSLPHPCVRIVLYCVAQSPKQFIVKLNECGPAIMTMVVVNFSVAYLLGIPIIVIVTYPAYRTRALGLIGIIIRIIFRNERVENKN